MPLYKSMLSPTEHVRAALLSTYSGRQVSLLGLVLSGAGHVFGHREELAAMVVAEHLLALVLAALEGE